jgi:hypothetical protein
MSDIDKRLSADIELDFPVEVDGNTIKTITIRRPKVRDQLKADRAKGTEFEKGLALLVDLTEQPQEVLLELDPVDLEKLDGQLAAFRGLAPTPES